MSSFKSQTEQDIQSTQHMKVEVDINFPRFLEEFEKLEKREADLLLKTLSRIETMTWNDIYRSSSKTAGEKRGINYEPLDSSDRDQSIATIRVTLRFRARVCRDRRKMILISLHPDHDSAYTED
ncbi:MAG: hypothetical protein EOP07_17595 [Proteobacteria bacterium]|nr:MAG: hypothetical protein EOP07_17595 [Pseudomonadota bacterium]